MVDLTPLENKAKAAVAACDAAPFMIRPHLIPLRCFIETLVDTITDLNAAGGFPGTQEKEN